MPRLGDPVAHQSATARGVACVVSGVLVRELGGRWGAGRLGAAGFTARCAVHGAGGGDSHRVGGGHAMAAGGPAGGGAAVEALAGLIKREGVAGVHDVLEQLELFSATSPNQVIKINAYAHIIMYKRFTVEQKRYSGGRDARY